jgi:hypothetical protein
MLANIDNFPELRARPTKKMNQELSSAQEKRTFAL